MMRIAIVISSLGAGGAQRVVVDLAAALVARGHEVSLITYSGVDSDHFRPPPGVPRSELNLLWPSRSLWHSFTSSLQRLRRMRSAIRGEQADVVVSFIDMSNILVLAASVGLPAKRVISERIDPRLHVLPLHWRIARRLVYPLADALVIQTEALRAWGKWVVPAWKLRVIPNAARPIEVRPLATETRERSILAVGRLHTQKGFDLLLRAFAASGLAARGWNLVIAGEGPERARLEALVAELALRPHVEMPGVLDHPEQLMARCGMFVLSSRFEGFPNVLIEAMACGAPAIAFDCPCGPDEIVEPGSNGLLVPTGDVPALARAMTALAGDAALRARLGDAGRQVTQRFSRQRVTDQWETLLAGLAGGAATARRKEA
jgi:glycosyltransferase involved in cell wall biosynthesis